MDDPSRGNAASAPPCVEAGRYFEAVLPLRLRDVGRARLLRHSLRKFFRDLKTLWVVAPEREFEAVRQGFGEDGQVSFLRDQDVVPELREHPHVHGWERQQLIKLAISQWLSAEFYLTLDADVLCVRPTGFDDLVRDGRALNYRYRGDVHAEWYRDSEQVLGLRRSGWVHGVTPSLLSRTAVGELFAYVAARHDPGGSARASSPAETAARARSVLLRRLPWTEYSLYFTYLEALGRYERYHVHHSRSLYGNCIWEAEDVPAWRAADCFVSDAPFHFTVIQSEFLIPVEELWTQLRPFLGDAEEGTSE